MTRVHWLAVVVDHYSAAVWGYFVAVAYEVVFLVAHEAVEARSWSWCFLVVAHPWKVVSL